MPIIQGKILEENTVYTDGWKAYDGLILNAYDNYCVFHSKDEFARGKYHVNGIESFLVLCKKAHGQVQWTDRQKLPIASHLKECEFRLTIELRKISFRFSGEYGKINPKLV